MTYHTIKVCMFVLFLRSLQCTPTNQTTVNFDADAAVLKKAMEGFGSNKTAIVNLLVHRSKSQRQEIKKVFMTRYGKDLIDELKSELEGSLEDAVVALMLPNNQLYAKELHHAFAGLGTDDKAVVEILSPMDNKEIKDVSSVYQKEYGTTLKDDLTSETSGSFRELLLSLCKAERKEDGKVDEISATQDAHDLIKATENRSEANESTYINILTTRSYPQLNKIFVEYKDLMKSDIVPVIKDKFLGSLKTGFLAIVKSTIKKSDYFAEQLQSAVAGVGTNDRQLIRIVVGRSEKDLGEIKTSFEKLYNKSLAEKITKDTSGEYRKLLLSLIPK